MSSQDLFLLPRWYQLGLQLVLSDAFLQPGPNERKSELLPAGWNANKDLYTLRYKSTDDRRELLLKAIMVDSSMILNVLVRLPAGWVLCKDRSLWGLSSPGGGEREVGCQCHPRKGGEAKNNSCDSLEHPFSWPPTSPSALGSY